MLDSNTMGARKLRWRKDGKRNISWDEAIWQYLLDHAHMVHNGNLLVKIDIPFDKQELIRRVRTRKEGRYRYTEEEIKQKAYHEIQS
jgi:hypothetical protein